MYIEDGLFSSSSDFQGASAVGLLLLNPESSLEVDARACWHPRVRRNFDLPPVTNRQKLRINCSGEAADFAGLPRPGRSKAVFTQITSNKKYAGCGHGTSQFNSCVG